MIPEALATTLVPGGRQQTGQHRVLVPFGKGTLARGPRDAVEGRQHQIVAYRQGGAAPWRRWRGMGVDQLNESQLLNQGVKQGRGAKLPGLHGVERRECLRVGEEVNWARICSITRSRGPR